MILNAKVKNYIDKSILCWLATSSKDLIPNVSPKEIFTHYQDEYILVANIASPGTVRNIKENSNVCVSIIDILIQKGFQIKGKATIVKQNEKDFEDLHPKLYALAGDKFPIPSITKIKVESIKEILAPSYIFYPENTSEQSQIENAKKAYHLL